MAPIVYLISGANRGIGFALVNEFASRENVVIFAGTRSVERGDGTANLYKLADAMPDKVFVVKLTSVDLENNIAAAKFIKEKAGRLDVVIANAGLGRSHASILEETADEMRAHWEINVNGPFVLFKAVYSLLCQESPRDPAVDPPPKFIAVSSTAGSIELGPSFSTISYGASKAALNYLIRKIHCEHENEGLVAFPLSPGPVHTDMWQAAIDDGALVAKKWTGQPPEENAKALAKLIDEATLENSGGKLVHRNGESRPW